jgi:hypothetical protein
MRQKQRHYEYQRAQGDCYRQREEVLQTEVKPVRAKDSCPGVGCEPQNDKQWQ